MSAITGIFYRDGRNVDEKQIKKMNDRLSHRGPDGSAIWCEGPVALGHQMLHTTPESLHEKLPFEEDGLVITADARIDNRKELSVKLEIEDKEEVSDSYFILKAYQKWGEKCPEELLGDFAFAIWDKDQEKLFCARDHMGVKPFYYYLSEDFFFFATEMKALFTIPEVPYELNNSKIAYYLMFEHFDKKLTFYEDIIRLPSACLLRVDHKNYSLSKYWKLDPNLRIKLDSERDYVNRFREIFAEAINCRLRSAVSVGFELSGGLDSSSIVCMTKEILANSNLTKKLKTFSFTFKEIPEVNERSYIKLVNDSGCIQHHFVCGDYVSPMYSNNIFWYLEQPFENPYITIKWKMYKKMQEKNIRIVLSGAGGDGTISHGKYYLKDVAYAFKLKKLIEELKNYSKLVNQSFFRLLLNNVFFPSLPTGIQRLFLSMKEKQKCILNSELKKRYLDKEYHNFMQLRQNATKTARDYHYFGLNYFDSQSNLEYVNKVSSVFDIELRYPYLDKRLVEFCYGIPDELKFKFGWGRYLQRISLINILPDEIRWRHSKTSFTPIIEKNLLLSEKDLEDILFNNNKLIEGYINLKVVKNIYFNYHSGKNYSIRDVHDLWLIMSLYYLLKHINNLNWK